MQTQNLESLLTIVNGNISELDGVIRSKADKIGERKKNIEKLSKDREENILKKAILLEACKKVRELSSDTFADICTSGVRTILGDDLSVKIIHGERNGVATSDFKLCSKYDGYETELEPTDEESGGGVADIVSLANFMTMNILNEGRNSAPIILDEPTKFVSLGNADKVGQFISYISSKFGKQIIMVTHAQDTAKYANQIVHVALNKSGISEANILDPDPNGQAVE